LTLQLFPVETIVTPNLICQNNPINQWKCFIQLDAGGWCFGPSCSYAPQWSIFFEISAKSVWVLVINATITTSWSEYYRIQDVPRRTTIVEISIRVISHIS